MEKERTNYQDPNQNRSDHIDYGVKVFGDLDNNYQSFSNLETIYQLNEDTDRLEKVGIRDLGAEYDAFKDCELANMFDRFLNNEPVVSIQNRFHGDSELDLRTELSTHVAQVKEYFKLPIDMSEADTQKWLEDNNKLVSKHIEEMTTPKEKEVVNEIEKEEVKKDEIKKEIIKESE